MGSKRERQYRDWEIKFKGVDAVTDRIDITNRVNIEQLGNDASKMSDAQVLDFYLKILIVKDIENQNEQQQTTQPEQAQETAQGQTTETNLQYQQLS